MCRIANAVDMVVELGAEEANVELAPIARVISRVLSDVRVFFFFFQAEDGIRDYKVTGVQTCALPIFKIAAADLLAINPRLVYGSITAYGEAGEEAHRTGFDATAYWARTGLMDMVRRSGERRVGEEWRSRGSPDHLKKKKKRDN